MDSTQNLTPGVKQNMQKDQIKNIDINCIENHLRNKELKLPKIIGHRSVYVLIDHFGSLSVIPVDFIQGLRHDFIREVLKNQ